MQLASFGCSLIYGNELADCAMQASNSTWPALLAKDFDIDYKCFAGGARGNLMIMDRLTSEIHRDPGRIFVVQWTFIDRFDYSDPNGHHHPPAKSTNDYLAVLPNTNSLESDFYFKNFHSEFRDKITNLVYIKTALDLLLEKRCKFVMTCVDDLIWCDEYHVNEAMKSWQDFIWSHSIFFDKKNFLHWCRDQGFDMGSRGHPLEQAHSAAAELVRPVIKDILHREKQS